jgi:hypothetical protein
VESKQEMSGSRPHGHDRRWTLCGKDPVCWKSTPVLQPPPRPDEDLSLLGPETYSDSSGIYFYIYCRNYCSVFVPGRPRAGTKTEQ